MFKLENTHYALIALLAIGTQSCSDSNISVVKEHRFVLDETLTQEQAFDNRKLCSQTEWSSFDDSKGRPIIEYSCSINMSEDGALLEQFNAYTQKKLKNEINKQYNEILKQTVYGQDHRGYPQLIKDLGYREEELKYAKKQLTEDPESKRQYNFFVNGKLPTVKPIEAIPLIEQEIKRVKLVNKPNTDKIAALEIEHGGIEGLMDEYSNNHSILSAKDIFQWSLDGEGKPTPLYAGVRVDVQNIGLIEVAQKKLKYAYQAVEKDKASNLHEYIMNSSHLHDKIHSKWLGDK
tara:strand:+ start:625 stop:1497 length:873 start_codon:yes stop_codon:yes gene_type:complete